MKEKNNSKELLIEYFKSNIGKDITRTQVISDTGISKSRLSELIKELRRDGYEFITPNRSGIIRLEGSENFVGDISDSDIRKWNILLAFSLEEAITEAKAISYHDLIKALVGLYDDSIDSVGNLLGKNYTDEDITAYVVKNHPQYETLFKKILPLSTLRKDLRELCNDGYVESKKINRRGNNNFYGYYLSAKAPIVFLKNENNMLMLQNNMHTIKDTIETSVPLKALYRRVVNILNWDPQDSNPYGFGKGNIISEQQMDCLNRFTAYPFDKKNLLIEYENESLKIEVGIIFYSKETSCFYAISRVTGDKTLRQLRIDTIKNIQVLRTNNSFYQSKEAKLIYEEMFNNSCEEEASDVKIIFQDFGNVKSKFEALKANRSKTAKIYEIENYIEGLPDNFCYVYEDRIRGMDSFARTLRAFGSSVLVLEPESLRKRMIESNKKILATYSGERL